MTFAVARVAHKVNRRTRETILCDAYVTHTFGPTTKLTYRCHGLFRMRLRSHHEMYVRDILHLLFPCVCTQPGASLKLSVTEFPRFLQRVASLVSPSKMDYTPRHIGTNCYIVSRCHALKPTAQRLTKFEPQETELSRDYLARRYPSIDRDILEPIFIRCRRKVDSSEGFFEKKGIKSRSVFNRIDGKMTSEKNDRREKFASKEPRERNILHTGAYCAPLYRSGDSSRARKRYETSRVSSRRFPTVDVLYCGNKGWIDIPAHVHATPPRSFSRISMPAEPMLSDVV